MANPDARDAALRRLTRVNRWLIAGSVAVTAVLAEVAAQAFPGKTVPSSAKAKTTGTRTQDPAGSSSSPSTGSGGSLNPPQAAPESAPSPATGQESSSTPSQETTPGQESAPSQQSSPAQEAGGTQQPAPTQETTPAQESTGPVVSGGS
jgi:hypothetical protein